MYVLHIFHRSTHHFLLTKMLTFLDLLDNDIAFYRNEGSVLILGDFNARTGSEPDFIINDDDNYLPLNDDYIIDNTFFSQK